MSPPRRSRRIKRTPRRRAPSEPSAKPATTERFSCFSCHPENYRSPGAQPLPAHRFDSSNWLVISTGRCNSRGVGEPRQLLAERDALGKEFLAVFVRQCLFVSFHPSCSCPLARHSPPRVRVAGDWQGNCEDRQKRTPTDTNGEIQNWNKDAESARILSLSAGLARSNSFQ
jgi:hypothetical protein